VKITSYIVTIPLFGMSSRGYKRSFQHIAKFYNYNTVVVNSFYSYGRRLLGLRSEASLALTSFLNLPAPGRCQSLYVDIKS